MLASSETSDKANLGRERVHSKYTYDHNANDYVAVFNRAIDKINEKRSLIFLRFVIHKSALF